jgi:transposase
VPGPHPPEFRRRAVELARAVDDDGKSLKSIAQIARDIGVSESCLRNWLAQDDVDRGDKPGLSTAERKELVELRRENRSSVTWLPSPVVVI